MKVLITDHGFPSIDQERAIVEAAGHTLEVAQCATESEVARAGAEADALLVQWAPVDTVALAGLRQCKVIVRYGIGVDRVNLAAARERGVAVCNVPDYCIDEVADHALSLALALGRQLPQIHRRLSGGIWKITPETPMPAFRDMTFATAGFGRIARAVLDRARGFGFHLAAYDPYVPAEAFAVAGVEALTLEELFARSDILSLHMPLLESTQHIVNAGRLATMKSYAIIVNTARGPLIDTLALAQALRSGRIGGAGLDVFEDEPLAADHLLRECDNALLTSHMAWYSEASAPRLQRMAAEEIVRGLGGEPLRSCVN